MTQDKIDTTLSLLGALGFSVGTKVGVETVLPMEHELITTGIHMVGTVVGGVLLWLITDFIKRKRKRKV